MPTPTLDSVWRDEQGLRGQFDALNKSVTVYGTTKPWNMPWGAVASAVTSSSDQSGITTAVDYTSLAISWTGATNRLYRVTMSVRIAQITSNGTQTIGIYTGTSGAGSRINEFVATVAATQLWPGQLVGITSGSGTLSAHGRGSTTAGTMLVQNSLQVGWILAEDIGPTGVPT